MGGRVSRLCHLCGTTFDNSEFCEHIDTYSDRQLLRWPGGLEALDRELVASMEESDG